MSRIAPSAAVILSLLCSTALIGGQVVMDGTFGHAGALSGPNYAIGAGLGHQVGSNLFQSFTTFNLDKGDSATFTAPANVTNILARVTGGAANIDGTIAARLDTSASAPHPANFYLIDSAGVVFGPDATLDIGGNFVVTTANSVRFADGTQFVASSEAPLLTASAPAGFGFLGSRPGDVSINGSTLAIPAGKGASIVAGDIAIVGGTIQASGGAINLVALDSAGKLKLDPASLLTPAAGHAAGTSGAVSLSNSSITVTGASGGNAGVAIQAQNLQLVAGSRIEANTTSSGTAGIAIDVSGAATFTGTGSNQGESELIAGNTSNHSAAASALVQLKARSIELSDAGSIISTVSAAGNGANLDVQASRTLTISGPSSGVSATAFAGTSGSDGSVTLKSPQLQILNGAIISSSTFAAGAGGDVHLQSSNLLLDGGSAGIAEIIADTLATSNAGRGGKVELATCTLTMQHAGLVSASSNGPGRCGDVVIRAGRMSMTTASNITSDMVGSGGGGSIHVNVLDNLFLSDVNLASSSIVADAGAIRIYAGGRVTAERSNITADALGGTGGDVALASGQRLILGHCLVTGTALGQGGSVSLSAPQIISLGNSDITAISENADGGSIRVDPLVLEMSGDSSIRANGGHNGGNISVAADVTPGVIFNGLLSRNVTATGQTGVSGSVSSGQFDPQLIGSLVSLSSPLASGTGLAPECGLRLGPDQSSFIITGRGGTPAEPGSWVPDLDLAGKIR